MPTFTATLSLPDFNAETLIKTLKKKVAIAHRRAFKAMLEFIRDGQLIPVDTGMSMGSFLNIAKRLRVEWPISPLRHGIKYHYSQGQVYRTQPTGIKSPELGAKMSSTAAQTNLFSEDNEKAWSGNKLRIRFRSSVFQFNLHEEEVWKVFKQALPTFEKVLVEELAKIRDISQYMLRKRITVKVKDNSPASLEEKYEDRPLVTKQILRE